MTQQSEKQTPQQKEQSSLQSIAPEKERGSIVYQVAGQDVKLSYQIVRNFLTKGNGQVTDQDLTQFISICKYNQLNPFLNEAYLVKFGTQPAQMIVSKEALMKRAEAYDTYEGIQGGVIVLRNNEQVELEGCFYMPTDKLIGGWAKVYRSDRKYPAVARVRLEEYDKKQSTWIEKTSTMISKVAKVQALREAFPTQLGAMYTAEEQGISAQEVAENNRNEAVNKAPEPIKAVDVTFEDVTPGVHTAREKAPEKAPEPEPEPVAANGEITGPGF